MSNDAITAYDLHDYETGDYIRPATLAEGRASVDEADRNGGAGAIMVRGRLVYAVGDCDRYNDGCKHGECNMRREREARVNAAVRTVAHKAST